MEMTGRRERWEYRSLHWERVTVYRYDREVMKSKSKSAQVISNFQLKNEGCC
jgi:hypothetical protein